MNTRTNYTMSVLCLLAGGIAGAAAALLLAPQSGHDTREAIARRAGETRDSARRIKDQLVKRSSDMLRDGAERIGGAAAALSRRNGADTAKDASAS